MAGAAVRFVSKIDRHRDEVVSLTMLGHSTKSIAQDLSISHSYVYIILREQGIQMMPVTAAERTSILAARKGANA